MDGRRFIGTIFSSQKTRIITQVVMNLPNDAVDFLGMCSLASKHSRCSQLYIVGASQ